VSDFRPVRRPIIGPQCLDEFLLRDRAVPRSAGGLTAVAVAAAAFGICYAGVIASLVEAWSINYLYSYGFAVPFIAAYIVWTRSQESPAPEGAPDYALGGPVTLAGIAMLVIGRLGTITGLEQASLIVTLTGLLLLVFGRAAVKSHWFALAYLLLMVPIWSVPIGHLQDPSRILSAKIATSLLDVSGLPVLRQDTNIILPSHTLSVMLECSGVNQLIAVTAMVLPAAYLWLDTISRRVALVILAVIISYLGNGFRIALVGWLAVNGLGDGDVNGTGMVHLLQGLGVSALGYLAIGGCFALLSTSKRATRERTSDDRPAPPAAVPSTLMGRRVWLDVAILLVMLGAGASQLSARELSVGLKEDLESLETRIDDWTIEIGAPSMAVRLPAIDDDLVDVGGYPTPTGERRFTAVDEELVRVYRNSSGQRVGLYVGYYDRQEDGKELTGEAGNTLALAASALAFPTGSQSLELNEIVREKDGTRRGVVFWYDVNGRIVSDLYRLKIHTIWEAVTRRRTNGAVVMIAWDGQAGAEAEAARQSALEFARSLMPALRRHLPS
jgi:EpsI family protein